MSRTLYAVRPTAASRCSLLLTGLLTWLIGLALPASGAPLPEPCRGALPLPADQALYGWATADEPARYAVEAAAPGLLIVEAHGIDASPVTPSVRGLDQGCRPRASQAPLPRIRGRSVQRVEEPGTRLVEVAADGAFRLDAWWVPDLGARAGAPAPRETTGGEGDDDPHEPMDEWEERPEVLCPWAKRPGLLSTFTCARRLWITGSGTLAVPALTHGDHDLVGVSLSRAGWLGVEAPGGAAAELFDGRGHRVGELSSGAPMRLSAGDYYLRFEAPDGMEPLRLDAVLEGSPD